MAILIKVPIIVFKDCNDFEGYIAWQFSPWGKGKATLIVCLHLQEERWSSLKPSADGRQRVLELYQQALPLLTANAKDFTVNTFISQELLLYY